MRMFKPTSYALAAAMAFISAAGRADDFSPLIREMTASFPDAALAACLRKFDNEGLPNQSSGLRLADLQGIQCERIAVQKGAPGYCIFYKDERLELQAFQKGFWVSGYDLTSLLYYPGGEFSQFGDLVTHYRQVGEGLSKFVGPTVPETKMLAKILHGAEAACAPPSV